MHHERGDDLRDFQGQIVAGNLACVVGVVAGLRETQQFGNELGIQRPACAVADGAAHGAGVEAADAFKGAVGVTQERLLMSVQRVRKERGLRLHAVGVSGNDGVDFALGHDLQRLDDLDGGADETREAIDVEARVGGGEDVLARAANMENACRHAAALQKLWLKRDVELGTHGAGRLPVLFHGVKRLGDGAGERFVDEA